jgi:WD40 repeat protein/tetratricopeptide (TPR) repeat protein
MPDLPKGFLPPEDEERTVFQRPERLPDDSHAESVRSEAAVKKDLTIAETPDAPGVSPSESTPPSIPGFEIVRELGRGGMGVVYLAWQSRLDRLVALKVVLAGGHAGKAERDRFQTEALAVARLQHPNIIQVYEVGEYDGRPYLALEYIDGGSLAQRLVGTPQPPAQAAALIETLARALASAHRRGVIHRDLTPGNILLGQDGVPRITDFGLAKLLVGGGPTQTGSGDILGTPSYMAPEQARGKAKQVTASVDIYALGALLYELLTGRPPFRGETLLETLEQVLHQEPLSLIRLQSKVPRDLETITLKCLEKDPGRRYPTAEALADDLNRFLAHKAISARPIGTVERAVKWARRQPTLAALVGVICLSVLGAFVLLAILWRNAEARAQAVLKLTTAEELLSQRQRELAALEQSAQEQQQLVEAKRAEVERLQQILPQEQAKVREARLITRRALYLRDMHAAQAALEQEDFGQLVKLLDRHQPPPGEEDVRGFEWHYLWRLCHGERLALRGHTGQNVRVRLAPDGHTLASFAADEGCLRVWDTRSGAALTRPWQDLTGVASAAYSPDGKILATGHLDWSVRLWDAPTGRLQTSFVALTGPVYGLAFSADGRKLALAGIDGLARVWDLTTQQTRAVFPPPEGQAPTPTAGGRANSPKLWDLAKVGTRAVVPDLNRIIWRAEISSDGQALATGQNQAVTVWDLATGRERFITRVQNPRSLPALTFSPDGKVLATAEGFYFGAESPTGQVLLWETATGKALPPALEVPQRGAFSLAYTPDGKTLAIGSNTGAVKLWDLPTRQVRRTFLGNTARAASIAFSADGKTLATSGHDKVVRLWDALSLDGPVHVQEATGRVTRVALAPDGATLAVCNSFGTLSLRDRTTGGERVLATGQNAEECCVAFALDSMSVATGSGDGTVKLWDVATGKERATLRGPGGQVSGVVFSPDGKWLVSGNLNGEIVCWDPRTGKQVFQMEQPIAGQGGVRCLAFSPDGNTLATGGWYGLIRLWDWKARAIRGSLRGGRGFRSDTTSLAFSPNGTLLAASNWDGTVTVWDLTQLQKQLPGIGAAAVGMGAMPGGKGLLGSVALLSSGADQELATFFGFQGAAIPVLFSPDGKTIISGHRNGAVKFWDTAMLQERFTLKCAVNMPFSLALSSDGKLLVASGGNGEVYLWDASKPSGRDWAFTPDPHSPEQEPAHYRREADEAEQAGQWFAVDWFLQRLIAAAPNDAGLRGRRGHALLRLGRAQEVVAEAKVLLDRNPNDLQAWTNRAEAYCRLGRFAEAFQDLRQALRRAPAEGPLWLRLSLVHAQLGQREEATAAYRRAVECAGVLSLQPQSSWGRRIRSAAVDSQRGWAEVAADGEEMLRAGKQDGTVERAAGLALAAVGQWSQAVLHFTKASEQQPGDVQTWRGLGRARAENGEWDKAAEAWTRSLTLDGDEWSVWYLRGLAREQAGQLEQAAADYTKGLELQPRCWQVRFRRGCTEAERKRWDQAAADFAALEAREDAEPVVWYAHAVVLLANDHPDAYRKLCTQALERFGTTEDPARAVGTVSTCVLSPTAGVDYARCVRLMEKVVAGQRIPFHLQRLGAALYRSGRHQEAARLLHEAVLLDSTGGHARDWLFLAMAYQRLHQSEQARQALAKALQCKEPVPPADLRLPLWEEGVEVQVLRREAEALLKTDKP